MTHTDIDWSVVLGPLAGDPGVCPQGDPRELQTAIFDHSPRAIRLKPNTAPESLPFATLPVPWFSRGYIVRDSSVRPGGFLHHAAGDYYVQDAASMLAIALADIQPGQLVCDTCAAPGGKSTAALELLAGQGLLVANEVIQSRLPVLKLALQRSGHANHLTTSAEVETLADVWPQQFDRVIVDAPCSGQSMVARGKQSLASFALHQIQHSAARQRRIMQAAASLLRPGGRLVYSTCTFAFAENEAIIGDFLAEHPTWSPAGAPQLAAWQSPLAAGCYRLWPHRDSCSGGFAAALLAGEPIDAPAGGGTALPTRVPGRQSSTTAVHADVLAELTPWLAEAADHPAHIDSYLWQTKRSLQLLSGLGRERLEAFVSDSAQQLSLAATPLAESKNSRWEPAYASSVLQQSHWTPLRSLALDDQQTLDYFTGLSVRSAKTRAADSGWCQVTWRQRPIAWGKLAGGVLKNHLPKPLRQNGLVN